MKLQYTFDETISITEFQQKINHYVEVLKDKEGIIKKLVIMRCNTPKYIVSLPDEYISGKLPITKENQLTLTEFHKNVAKYTKLVQVLGEYVIIKQNKPYFIINSIECYENKE